MSGRTALLKIVVVAAFLAVLAATLGFIAVGTAAAEEDVDEEEPPEDPSDDPLRGGDDGDGEGGEVDDEGPEEYEDEIVEGELYVVDAEWEGQTAHIIVWSSEARTLQLQDVSAWADGEDGSYEMHASQERVDSGETTVTIPATSTDREDAVAVSWYDTSDETLYSHVEDRGASSRGGLIQYLGSSAALLAGAAITAIVAGIAGYQARKEEYIDRPISPFNRGDQP